MDVHLFGPQFNMAVENWISQTDAISRLGVSRQQLHRLRNAGIVKYKVVPGKRGMVPKYWLPDILRRKSSGPRAGRKRPSHVPERWKQRPIFEILNHFIRSHECAEYIFNACIRARVPFDFPSEELYKTLASGQDIDGNKGTFVIGDAERIKALVFVANDIQFNWLDLARKHQDSFTECSLWTLFVREVLPSEYRGEVDFINRSEGTWLE